MHTPLPWKAAIGPDDRFPHKGNVYGADGIIVASLAGVWREGVESEANAEFIVRACNSHEELLAALRFVCAEIRNRSSLEHLERCANLAEEVMAKAEGRDA